MLETHPDLSDRAGRLFKLARLELEVGILRSTGSRGVDDAGLEAAALTTRRLLATCPGFGEADQVRFFLAQVELRRGRRKAALEVLTDLGRLHPKSRLRCKVWLLEGELLAALGDREAAARALRRVMQGSGCSTGQRHHARYKLAWSLLAGKRPGRAASHLRSLCDSKGLDPLLKRRALKDLALAWSLTADPIDADAASFLVRHAGKEGGYRLVAGLGRRLLDEGKTEALLKLTADFLQRWAKHRGADHLRVLRIRALASSTSSAGLEAELARVKRRLARHPRGSKLRQVAAQALLNRALRATAAGKMRRLLERLVGGYHDTSAGRKGRLHLAEVLIGLGEIAHAARHLEAAAAITKGDIRARVRYRLVWCLERMLSSLPEDDPRGPDRKRAALDRFVRAAQQFIEHHRRSPEAPRVLMALAERQLDAGSYHKAARAALQLLERYPRAAQRGLAVEHALVAMRRGGQPQKAYDLARVELKRCQGQCEAIRRQASGAALALSKAAISSGRWALAHDWTQRAIDLLPQPAPKHLSRLLLAAARLASRAGRQKEAEQHYRRLITEPRRSKSRRARAMEALSEHLEASGKLREATKVYLSLAGEARRALDRIDWLFRAARASRHAQDGPAARRLAHRLRRALAKEVLPPRVAARYMLKVGTLLSDKQAYGHYLRQAHLIWRRHPRIAARCLVRAAARSTRPRRARGLLEQATGLAGPLKRAGKVSRAAVEARMALVQWHRARSIPAGREKLADRLLVLQGLLEQLLELVRLKHPRWSAEAGVELAWVYGELARTLRRARGSAEEVELLHRRAAELEALSQQLRRRLGILALRAGEMSKTTPHLALPPDGHQVAPVAERIRSNRHIAAAHVATMGLRVHGPRADLRCARGVAQLAQGLVSEALLDLRAALKLDPESRCAKLNLASLHQRARGGAR